MFNNKSNYLLIALFLFFYIFNYLTPMAFGDDYVYSFIWEGHSMYEPMSEQVRRLSSFHDLLVSQWSHYFTGNGRTINHTIAQFFLWIGKDVFNIFNALVSVLLIMEIYWCANRGTISFNFKIGRLIFIFFALWAFTLSFSTIFFWLSAACNYLWTAVLLLGFLLPYIRKYYFLEEKLADNNRFQYAMFLFGIIAGWSNENSICWIILVLSTFNYVSRKRKDAECWMFAGLIGLVIGYALLILSPGNVARLQAETGTSSGWLTGGLLKTNFRMLAGALCFQFLLWYFNLRFILQQRSNKSKDVKQEQFFVQLLCILSFAMTAIMLFSPNFPPRSSFPGMVQLVIATSVLLRVQEEYEMELINKNAKKFLCTVGAIYFLISTTASLYGFYDYHMQIQTILSFVKHSEQGRAKIVTVPSLVPVSETIANMSGLHILFYEMSEDANNWRNTAFARYYGLKGVRMVKNH